MKAPDLILRCYLAKRPDHWEAFCIDLCLAAQGSTREEVRRLLEQQIVAYVEEALTVDRQYAAQLLSRRAPLKQRVEYALIKFGQAVHAVRSNIRQVFTSVLPVHVRNHRCA